MVVVVLGIIFGFKIGKRREGLVLGNVFYVVVFYCEGGWGSG